jgi:hypothetical protein
MACADAIRCRPAARWPSTARLLRRRHGGARGPSADRPIEREEIAGLPPADWDSVIVATGPLTSPALAEAIRR